MKTFLTCLIMMATAGVSSLALAADNLDPAEATANKHYQVSGNWSQLKHGWNVLSLKVTNPNNEPITGATVTVAYEMVEMPMNSPDKPVIEKGDGFYEKRVFMSMAGHWKFDITVDANSLEDTATKIQQVNN